MIAGPSEIAVLADETAKPNELAADLLSQAEHDARACSVLVTTSRELAEEVSAEVEKQLKPYRVKDCRASIADYGVIYVTETEDEAIETVNRLAPEHLEIMTENPMEKVGTNSSCWGYFFRTLQCGTSWRLLCWSKPRIANQWNSPFFKSIKY